MSIKQANGIKRGDVVTLTTEFKTGSTHPKEKVRIYPAGTRGVVLGRDFALLKVTMEDPHGLDYKEKVINVHKSSVKV